MEVMEKTDAERLADILEALRKNKIPLKYQDQRKLPGGGTKPFAKWHVFLKYLDHHALNYWEFTTEAPTTAEAWYKDGTVIPTISVSATLTIRVGNHSISRGSIGTVKANETGRGLPADSAKWIALKQCCRMFGIWLERPAETSSARNDYHKEKPASDKRSDKRATHQNGSQANPSHPPAAPAKSAQNGQISAIRSLWGKAGHSENDLQALLFERYGKNDVTQLSFADASDMIKHLQSA